MTNVPIKQSHIIAAPPKPHGNDNHFVFFTPQEIKMMALYRSLRQQGALASHELNQPEKVNIPHK